MTQINIALAGNPNSGKTTLFNGITGSFQHVGNWPGVTIEKKEALLRGRSDVLIQDLPGIYSLSPFTIDETIARNYLLYERPDAIINIVDATNIERNLYLTTQLLELGIPVVVALNMIDIVRKRGIVIDKKKLSALLKCEVYEVSALKGEGGDRVAIAALNAARKARGESGVKEPDHIFSGSVEHALAHIEESIESLVDRRALRWYSIKVFERDQKVLEKLKLPEDLARHLEEHIVDCEKELDDDAESIITNERYNFVAGVVGQAVEKGKGTGGIKLSLSDKIDRVVTNRILALPIFVLIMGLVYYISISTIGDWLTGWTEDFLAETVSGGVEALLEGAGIADWLTRLIVEGIVGGAGAVLSFLPQMAVLFLLLAVLEDVGYMARAAFIMDRIFRKFGLSGKSVIPMLISSGCAVPGIMATRTIEQERDRRMTVMTTSFIPCSAKIPIVAMVAGIFFGNAAWVATSAYFVGIAAVFFSGIILKKMKAFAGKPAPFLMELPDYHIPAWVNVLRSTWERIWSFIVRAGTVIVAASIFIWFTSNYGIVSQSEEWERGGIAQVEEMDESFLGVAGSWISPIFRPLGFGSWQMTVATVMGMIAKEGVVGAFGVLYNVQVDESGEQLLFEEGVDDAGEVVYTTAPTRTNRISEAFAESAPAYPAVGAYAFLVFNLLVAPCVASIGAARREMNSGRWTWGMIGYMTGFAYMISLMVYQWSAYFKTGVFGAGTAAAVVATLLFLYLLFRRGHRPAEESTSRTKGVVK